ncbi:phosphoenolpyruvate--protein phosphotransferase [Oxalobacter paraformigenes]|uniref:Phosphoenolpyruvate-protein phosphotransferase n=1 Tax=Oxalobacter paraformigenes TaxID=556268 RepID=C3X5L6_9BURK|nr:phosphoenolpyruvate--protein phosphotransferase [Oxalobacter paraformigenes]EEO28502.1 phosphoenolpyruvate-protein phosphotransferase [Oxalobacter paraformigenes]
MASFALFGISVSRGISIGRAHLIAHAAMDTKHYLVPQEKVEAEVERLQQALSTVQKELETIWSNLPQDAPVELGAFLDVHAMILADSAISKEPFNIIRTRRYNAEWALLTQIEELSTKFERIEDPYLRERKADIQQVAERIMKVLTGTPTNYHHPVAAEPDSERVDMIVVAYDISPADMLQFRDDTFSGFVSEIGGRNSHAAIVARSIDTPAVFGLAGALSLIRQDDWLIVDADAGIVIVNPTPLVLEQYRARQAAQAKARKKLSRLKKTPTVTIDGTPVALLANIEFPDDCTVALENGATGIGLFRSEFLFMGRSGSISKIPSEEEQFEAYKKAVTLMKGRPVTIRTLDIGADKPIGTPESGTLNPALGKRAIRYCLAEPDLFLAQLRAILRASAFGPVKLMIPMLVHAFEIDQTLALIEEAKSQLRAANRKFDEAIKIGAMVEVPAAILGLPMFTSRLDFISIGTNDLIQYTLAIDRVDPEVAHLYNPLHPAILSMLSMTIWAAGKAGIPVSVCGEVAGDPHLTRLLLGMGLREFSMHPAQLLNVKQEILASDLKVLKPKVDKILVLVEEDAIEKAVNDLQLDEAPVVDA